MRHLFREKMEVEGKKKLCGHFGVPHYNFINDVVVKMRNTQHLENYFKPKVVRQRKCSIKRVFVKRFVLFSKRHAICFVPSHRWVRHMKKHAHSRTHVNKGGETNTQMHSHTHPHIHTVLKQKNRIHFYYEMEWALPRKGEVVFLRCKWKKPAGNKRVLFIALIS